MLPTWAIKPLMIIGGALLAALLIFVPVKCQKQKYINEGKAAVQKDWDAATAKTNAEIAELRAKKEKVTTKTEYVTVEKVKIIKVKGDEIIKRVEVFVPTDSGMLTGGFRVFHDAAAENRIPDTSAIPNAEATAVRDVAETVAKNYEKCHVAYALVDSWQTWAKEQCALNDKGCPDSAR